MSLFGRGRERDPEGLREALAGVPHPLTGLTLGDMGTLRDVTVRGAHALVEIEDLAVEGAEAEDLAHRIRAVAEAAGAGSVEVRASRLAPEQRMHVGRLLRGRQEDFALRPPPVIAVASGKGGVGKSTVTANLAATLAAQGKRVGLLDADVWGYSQPHLFGVREAPHAVAGIMLPARAYGVRLMSTGFFVSEDEPIMWRGPMLDKAIQQFVSDVAWGDLDVLLVDLPPGTGDVQLSLLAHLPSVEFLVVTTPQRTAVDVAARVGRMALDSRLPIAGVVENMTAALCPHCGEQHRVFGSGGGDELARRLATEVVGRIPLDEHTVAAADRGVPQVVDAPESVVAQAFVELAGRLPLRRASLLGRTLPLSVV